MRQRAKRMVREARVQEPGLSVNTACKRIGPQLGILPDTLRGWCKQADIDDGLAPGVSTAESEELKRLRRENAELRRGHQNLQTAAAVFAAAGVDPPIAPSSDTSIHTNTPSGAGPSLVPFR